MKTCLLSIAPNKSILIMHLPDMIIVIISNYDISSNSKVYFKFYFSAEHMALL